MEKLDFKNVNNQQTIQVSSKIIPVTKFMFNLYLFDYFKSVPF